jgi:hypothetical protein
MILATAVSARRRPTRQRLLVDIDLIGTLAALTDINGILVSGVNASAVLKISKHIGQTYDAWSKFATDAIAHSLGQKPWQNTFRVTQGDGTMNEYLTDQFDAVNDARDNAIANPVYVTGSTSYMIWIWDDNSGDNRGGLSVRVEYA